MTRPWHRLAVTPLVLGCAPLALSAAAAGWLLASLPLLLAGVYRPVPATLLAGPAALALAWLVLRRCPRLDGPAWAGWLTLVVVAGFLVLAWSFSSEHVVLRRDPGSYTLYAQWLSAHGILPIPASARVFGPGVTFSSPGFYAAGGSVVPQFLPGTPLLLAAAGWVGGLSGILHANALLGAGALLAVAGLTARLVGPRAAPFTALAVGAMYPVLHAARSPYSEPLALLLLFGGLALLAERRADLLGGLFAGLATVARIDAPADLLLLAPYAVLVSPAAGAGAGLGVGTGLLTGAVLSRPYLASLGGPLLQIAAAVVLLTAAALAARGRWRAGFRPAWLAPAAAAAVAVVGLVFTLRPLLQTVRRPNSASGMIGALQRRQGLPFDPTRTYDEWTLHWVAWWVGWPALILAFGGCALLVRRRLATVPWMGSYDPAALLLVLAAATLIVLWQPSITPDHPWADRRLVPVLLPALAICAAWALARVPPLWAAGGAVVALVPVLAATKPLLGAATERGQVATVQHVCTALGPRSAVVVTGSRARNELPQTLRGLCGLPVGVVSERQLRATLPALQRAVAAAGRSLDVVAMTPEVLRVAGLTPRHVVSLHTREDARLLLHRPAGTVPLSVNVWVARAGG